MPEDPRAARYELGLEDGCRSLFENHHVWTLSYGDDSYTEFDCPVGGVRASQASADKGGCSGNAHGRPVRIRITSGDVNCKGALALADEWMRRAPTEGEGSSAAMELYGWLCSGATATEPHRIGSCSRPDKDDEFEILRTRR